MVILGCLGAGSFVLLVALGPAGISLLVSEVTAIGTAGLRQGVHASPREIARSDVSAAAPATTTEPQRPSFDLVRVAPVGTAVVAGRAAPEADVTIAANGTEIGHAHADERGEWVFVPTTPLEQGGQELTLTSRGADGLVWQGNAPVLVIVPAPAILSAARPTPAAQPMVLLTPADAPPRLLQTPLPAGEASKIAGSNARAKLGLDLVDYDEQGAIRFAGRAPAGAGVRVYIDEHDAGDAMADPQGRWALTPAASVATGDHQLRVDQLASDGRVASRVELPFQRVNLPLGALGSNRVVVQPRQTLWQIARRAYGQGVRYTVIYEANLDQIRDPARIYPGQVFALPPRAPGLGEKSGGSPSPASSSRVR